LQVAKIDCQSNRVRNTCLVSLQSKTVFAEKAAKQIPANNINQGTSQGTRIRKTRIHAKSLFTMGYLSAIGVISLTLISEQTRTDAKKYQKKPTSISGSGY
jgi:hypothetical protein